MSARRKQKKRRRRAQKGEIAESTASVALTVAWTVSVVMVFFCDLGAAAIQSVGWLVSEPDRTRVPALILLCSGSLVGLIVLALLPVVLRIRRVPPPEGFIVFAVVASVTPILALVGWAVL